MATAEQMLTGPRAPGVATSPLLERIRRGVIGEGELMDGPFGPRRVTYAYEHHSNELPWRESIADVVVIGEDADGHIDVADLGRQLARAVLAARPAHLDDEPTGLPPDFEALRWFPLPPACLQSPGRNKVRPCLLYG